MPRNHYGKSVKSHQPFESGSRTLRKAKSQTASRTARLVFRQTIAFVRKLPAREKEYRNTATVHMVAQIIRPPLFPASQVAMVGNSKRQSATLPQKRRLTIGKNPASARHEIENKTLSLFSD